MFGRSSGAGECRGAVLSDLSVWVGGWVGGGGEGQAGSASVDDEPAAGPGACDVVLQLPWGLRLRRRFPADGPPAGPVRFLLARAAERLAGAGGAAAEEEEEEEEERWGRLVAGGFCLKSFEGVVVRWDPAAAVAVGAGGASGVAAGVTKARGATLGGCGLGRMEKLVVELAEDAGGPG